MLVLLHIAAPQGFKVREIQEGLGTELGGDRATKSCSALPANHQSVSKTGPWNSTWFSSAAGLPGLEAAQQRLSFSTTYEHKQLEIISGHPPARFGMIRVCPGLHGAFPFSGTLSSPADWHTENFLSVHNILTSALSKASQRTQFVLHGVTALGTLLLLLIRNICSIVLERDGFSRQWGLLLLKAPTSPLGACRGSLAEQPLQAEFQSLLCSKSLFLQTCSTLCRPRVPGTIFSIAPLTFQLGCTDWIHRGQETLEPCTQLTPGLPHSPSEMSVSAVQLTEMTTLF